jgi:hypothetical protein
MQKSAEKTRFSCLWRRNSNVCENTDLKLNILAYFSLSDRLIFLVLMLCDLGRCVSDREKNGLVIKWSGDFGA